MWRNSESLTLEASPRRARRQGHDVAAAVGRVAAAFDQAAFLEFVEQADDVARVQAQRLAERVLRHRPVVPQELDRDQVPGSQAAGRLAGVGRAAAEAGEVVDQRQDLASLSSSSSIRHVLTIPPRAKGFRDHQYY